jgi:hypothetical protein
VIDGKLLGLIFKFPVVVGGWVLGRSCKGFVRGLRRLGGKVERS